MRRETMLVTLVLTFAAFCGAEEANGREWRPVEDEVYLQEVGRKVESAKPILAVAMHEEQVYCGREDGVYALRGDAFEPFGDVRERVRRMKALEGALWVITDNGLYRLQGGTLGKVADGDFRDICVHLGDVVVAGVDKAMRVVGDGLEPIASCALPTAPLRIDSYSETLYFLFPGRLALFAGTVLDGVNVVDWGQLPSDVTHDMLVQGSRLYVATDRGLGLLRGMAMTPIRGAQGLCYEDTTCLAEGFDHDLWIGTTEGAIRNVEGEYQYFAADRWLPNNHVNAIACGEHAVYIATDGGLGIIEYEPYTLLKKAAYYERHLEEWGQKRLGFTHKLEWDDGLGEWVREISDNDAGWSTHYLCAQCFK